MTLANPGHVKNAVTHGASKGAIALGVVGAIGGGVIVFFTWPEIMAGSAVIAGALEISGASTAIAVGGAGGVVSTWSGWGMELGKRAIDQFSADAVAGHLVTGFESVLLGPGIDPAARADEDTKADCHGEAVGWEGSSTVSLGLKPMSRVGDRLKCQGKILDGLATCAVGGDPVHEGKALDEAGNPIVYWMTLGNDVLGILGSPDESAVKFAAKAILAGTTTALDSKEAPAGEYLGALGGAQGARDTVGLFKK